MLSYEQLKQLFIAESRAKKTGHHAIADCIFTLLLREKRRALEGQKYPAMASIRLGYETRHPHEVGLRLQQNGYGGYYDLPTIIHVHRRYTVSMCIPLPRLSPNAIEVLHEAWIKGVLEIIQSRNHHRKNNTMNSYEQQQVREELLKKIHTLFSGSTVNEVRTEYLVPKPNRNR